MALASDGASVTLLVRDRASGEALQSRIHGNSNVVTADVVNEEAVNTACAAAVVKLGPVNILVNNAGSAESAPFVRTDGAMFARMLAVHLYGPLYCTHAVLPAMLDAGYGRIVNVASVAGLSGAPYITAYSSAKHALVGLTRSLAKEVIAQGVTVNAVCPSYTETDMVATSIERVRARTGRSAEEARAALLAHNPLKRLVLPTEVAAAVRWLCTDGAASTTGQTIIIDGGELA